MYRLEIEKPAFVGFDSIPFLKGIGEAYVQPLAAAVL
ncbi:MAG: hypothetical protein ACJAZC_002944 [Cryomorphaceae bacterium]|jgi:hypothetical protein